MTHHPNPIPFAILVVEDDPLLLIDAMDLAEDAGFTAYGARTATEAMSVLKDHEEIRVLFTDVYMPGPADGLQLAHVVRRRWPHVSIIVTSACLRPTRSDLPRGGTFISKPYAPDVVAARFRGISETLVC